MELVPEKGIPTTNKLNKNLFLEAEKAIRLALSLEDTVPLNIEKSVKTPEVGAFPKY